MRMNCAMVQRRLALVLLSLWMQAPAQSLASTMARLSLFAPVLVLGKPPSLPATLALPKSRQSAQLGPRILTTLLSLPSVPSGRPQLLSLVASMSHNGMVLVSAARLRLLVAQLFRPTLGTWKAVLRRLVL